MAAQTQETRFAGPVEFDTELAKLCGKHDDIANRIHAAEEDAHRKAGDKPTYRGRTRVWGMTHADALAKVPAVSAHRDALFTELVGVQAEIQAMNEKYTGWSRFYPTRTKTGGHIHSSQGCRTLHATTDVRWAPEMSGQTEAQAVAALDDALCTVCFPSAPVALHNYVSKHTQAERDQRAAEKAERAARAAAKQLTSDEQFRTVYGNDRVTTVAACKQIIREAINSRAELASYRWRTSHNQWTAHISADDVARITGNVARILAEREQDAAKAEDVLLARETANAGYGATADEIVTLKVNAEKRAAKDWAA